ncbi:MAG TPA: DUF692 family multinuclear iron-containing protein [Nitrospira sp.]|jgi:hypothetical protein
MSVGRQFERRVQAIPKLGLGLSVDVYSPDLCDVMSRFEGTTCRPAYLEIFRATPAALRAVSRCMGGLPLTYHGEGLWITQPEFSSMPFLERELDQVASELKLLCSPWLNHECATKQMAGYTFGTYLPPLYTPESAKLVAGNIALVQERLDKTRKPGDDFGPLFLLEMPPLTYFMAGTISVSEYFRLVTECTPCGLVLDIGHLWTVYRYSAAGRQTSLEQFVEQFLDEFPMDRVVEIHIAGLALHEGGRHVGAPPGCPEWIDAHAASIPDVSWGILDQVLVRPGLRHLRGVALEVDTKLPDLIVEELAIARRRVGPLIDPLLKPKATSPSTNVEPLPCGSRLHETEIDRRRLEEDYVRYAHIVSGQEPPNGPAWNAAIDDPSGLKRYIQAYLPHEILHWGGELTDMFPETCRSLHQQGVALDDFVPWWFHEPRPADRPYDFFLLKMDRFVEFVGQRAPALLDLAHDEAKVLRQAYEEANEGSRHLTESCP